MSYGKGFYAMLSRQHDNQWLLGNIKSFMMCDCRVKYTILVYKVAIKI